MNDDDLELASAYLDDEVTDAERARVEASPELQRLVDDLRGARDAVAAVDPPPAAARDAAIAAALAVFDEEQQPAPPHNVVPIERAGRWRWRHGLGVAAAAVAVVVAGVAVLRDNAEAPSDVQTASERTGVASSVAPTAEEFDATAAGTESDVDEVDEVETNEDDEGDEGDETETAAADESMTMAASAAESADAPPEPAALPAAPAPAAAANDESPPTTAVLAEITTTSELAALAEQLVDEGGAPLPDRRAAREQCRDDEDRATPTLVADAVYVDEDGVVYEIVVVDDNGEAAGLDLQSCDLVVRADH
jgi:hypothetical protein